MIDQDEFLRKFSENLLEGNGAVFVGAGLSVAEGYVDWKELLREIANDLGLDIEKERDLVAVAQYEQNRTNSRDALSAAVLRHFTSTTIRDNHKLLAKLPIDTVWTTNYDKLLEAGFQHTRRRAAVKHTVDQLRIREPYADVTVFKMHGDVDHPADAVLTKDDYECYESKREAFIVQLLSDLLNKTFLFLGFSFSDPNIDYTFNRLRRLLNPQMRSGVSKTHYCILKKPDRGDFDSDSEFTMEERQFDHRVTDLKRYGIQTVPIEAYNEITALLENLNRRVGTRSVMISGAAEDFGPRGAEWMNEFCGRLGRELVEQDCDIVSGVGKGISASIMIGAHEAIARPGSGRLGQRIRLFPFPYWMADGPERSAYYQDNRREMVSQAGVSIVISGNKSVDGTIINSPGVAEEIRLAREAGHWIIPVGATGHAARAIWEEANSDLESWLPDIDGAEEFARLNDDGQTAEEMVETVMKVIEKIRCPNSRTSRE